MRPVVRSLHSLTQDFPVTNESIATTLTRHEERIEAVETLAVKVERKLDRIVMAILVLALSIIAHAVVKG